MNITDKMIQNQKIRWQIFIIVFSLLFSVSHGSDDQGLDADTETLFNAGNELYVSGEYEEAYAHYRDAIKAGGEDAVLSYNAGNAAFRSGDIGRAVLHYMKARRLAPRDALIKANLELTLSLLKDKVPEKDQGIFTAIIDYLWELASLRELLMALSVFLFSLWVFMSILPWLKKPFARASVLSLTALVIIFCLITTPLAIGKYHTEVLKRRAVVVEEEVKAHSGPSETYSEVFTVHEGTSGILGTESQGWTQIILDNGFSGWIKKDSVEELAEG